jgi:hypothetical protein
MSLFLGAIGFGTVIVHLPQHGAYHLTSSDQGSTFHDLLCWHFASASKEY